MKKFMRSRTWIAVNVLEFFVIEISKVSGNRVFWALKPSLVNNGRAKCLKGTKQVVLAWCLQSYHCQCICIWNFAFVFVFVKISMFWPAGVPLTNDEPFHRKSDLIRRLIDQTCHRFDPRLGFFFNLCQKENRTCHWFTLFSSICYKNK